MQDAHGKDTFYMKNGLCGDCKKHLQKILGYDLTGCKSPLGGAQYSDENKNRVGEKASWAFHPTRYLLPPKWLMSTVPLRRGP